MAELLLPTQQVHLNGGNAHGVQSRFHSPTPDKSIAFQVDPNRNITMMKDAVEAITKHLEDVQKEKEDALIAQASNLYQEAVASETNRYENLQGENAVKGFEDFQKNITDLDSEFGKTFKNSRLQSGLNKLKQNTTLNARINGRNWHDKQVYAFAKSERLATLETTSRNYINNFGSPNDKNNLTQLQYAIDDIIQKDHGVMDKDSDLYKQYAQTYYGKAFKPSLALQIKENPSMAKVNLERVRPLISDELYRELKLDVKDEELRQYKEALHLQNLKEHANLLAQKQKDQLAKELTEPMKPSKWQEKYEGYVEEMTHKKGKAFTFLSPEEQAEVRNTATKLANMDRLIWNTQAKQWSDDSYLLKLNLKDEIVSAITDGTYNYYSPIDSIKDPQLKAIAQDSFKTLEEANNFIDNEAKIMKTGGTEQGWRDYQFLSVEEKVNLAHDPTALSNWIDEHGVPATHWKELRNDLDKTAQAVANGELDISVSKPILKFKDTFAQMFKKKRYAEVTDPTDRYVMQELMVESEKELMRQAKDESGKIINPYAYDDRNIEKIIHITEARHKDKLQQESEDINSLSKDLLKAFKNGDNALFMRWNKNTNDAEREQYLKEKILDYKHNHKGAMPTKPVMVDVLVNLAIENRGLSDPIITNVDELLRDVDRSGLQPDNIYQASEYTTDYGTHSMWNLR